MGRWRGTAAQIAVAYAVASTVWILASGWLVITFLPDPYRGYLEDAKGLLFVAVTAIALYAAMHRREGLLRAETDRLSRVMELSPIGIELLDRHGGLVTANTSAQQIRAGSVNWPTAAVAEGAWSVTTALDGTPVDESSLPATIAIRDGKISRAEVRVELPNGRAKYVATSAAPIFDEFGEIDGAVLVLNDITDDVVTAHELKRQKDEAQLYLDTALALIVALDLEGRITMVNKEGCRVLGYDECELIGMKLEDLYAPELRAEAREVLSEWVRTGVKSEPVLRRIVRKDGNERVISGSATGIKGPDGRLERILLSGEDVTVRERSREALAREASINAAILRTADAFVIMYRPNGIVMNVNPYAQRMSGFGEAEIVGRNFREFIVIPEDTGEDAFWAKVGDAPGLVRYLEAGWKCKDGSARTLGWSSGVMRNESEEIEAYIGVAIDVTDRARTEEQLRQTQQQYHSLFHNMPLGFLLLEAVRDDSGAVRDFHYVESNPAFRFFGGASARGLTGANTILGNHPHGLAKDLLSLCIGVEATGVPVTRPGYMASEDMHLDTVIFKESDGLVGALFTDTTDVVKAANAIQELNDTLEERVSVRTIELRESNEALEAFSYSVSHDLRAPLRAIGGYSEILIDRYRSVLDDQGAHYLDNIVVAAQRMGELIDDLLEYSRIGRRGRNSQATVEEVLSQVLEGLAPRIAETGAEISLPQSSCEILADATLLRQVMSNLITNALTFHAVGLPPRIEISCEAGSSAMDIVVRDHGIGVPSEQQQRIFDVFQRLHSVDEFPGTGIGLAIVKKAVALLGGKVWVESPNGDGSAFHVLLPMGPLVAVEDGL